MERYILSIDQGTTGTRASIFDENGELIGYAYREHSQIYPRPGWVEHDPVEIWVNTKHVIKKALETLGIPPSSIAGIGDTNQRETITAWNPRTGTPYYNAIVWQCRRTAPLVEKLREYSDVIKEKIRTYTRCILLRDQDMVVARQHPWPQGESR